ncbi:serine protease [Porphyromonas sp.]|uniref:trypsin-like serine peptidase n=1 Tax=Porphyromonas sp. TaxID=1924944 RepID=UPI0026DDBFF9|nr:trypsin-like serine protease [Porphyromonas sp.]MDO4695849.1 trypsin-like serine protease [Porphyromonas sp.]MDO4771440.1 trypsin-like serine protease [Porphyromonas sp.]
MKKSNELNETLIFSSFCSNQSEECPIGNQVSSEMEDTECVSAESVAYQQPSGRSKGTKKKKSELTMEAIIGEDERQHISPKEYPFTAICSLKIKTKTGRNYLGTGFFITRRILLTAGHCVYIHSEGGWAKSIEVIPGRDGKESPWGSVKATQFHALQGWISKQNSSYDFGVIVLPESSPLGEKVGWFGYKTFREPEYKKHELHISGYPGDKGGARQWYMSGYGTAKGPLLKYEIDTMGGQSGSPVWMKEDAKCYALGVHTMGNPQMGNFATCISRYIARFINEIKKSNP